MDSEKPLLKSFSDLFDKKHEAHLNEQRLAEAIKKDLDALYPKIQAFYAGYHENSIRAFINHYALVKHAYIRNTEYYAQTAEETLLEFRPQAEKCLWHIQQKKLFNLQCLWRAGQITLEGINTSFDFMYWENDIQHCPCVEPITQEEVELYIRYLHDPNCNADGTAFLHGWQDYDHYKAAQQGDDGDVVPAWYAYYDTYMGTTALLNLPDVKSPKERIYREAYQANKIKQETAAGKLTATPQQGEQKPFLRYFEEKELMRFVSEFESAENQELFLNYQHVNYQPSRDDRAIKEELENAIYLTLSKAKEHVPIEAHSDWRQAVILAAKKYKQEKIAEALPSVFEEYQFKLEAGIGYPALEKPNPYEWVKEIGAEILKGRELLGEPGDFDY